MATAEIHGMTAVTAAKTGNPTAILLIVLKVDPNSPTDSYTGILFSLILGKCNWSLANVTFGSWTKLPNCLAITLLYYGYKLRQIGWQIVQW